MYVPSPVQPPESPRVRELSQRIQQVIADFQRQYPMTPAEIREALLHAAGGLAGPRRLAVALGAGLVAALGMGVYVARRAGTGGDGAAWMPIAALVGVMAAMAAIVLAIKRSR